jgi:hypothetical protein
MEKKKALVVATAITGGVAGAAAFLPTTPAHAVTGGWQFEVTMGGRITWAAIYGTDRQDNYVSETAVNDTGQVRYSVPFEQNGVQRTFPGPQSIFFSYGGPTVGRFSYLCPVNAGSGTQIWSAAVKTHNC